MRREGVTYYLKGFNDGYKKAIESKESTQANIIMDGKTVAKLCEEEINKLQKRDMRKRYPC